MLKSLSTFVVGLALVAAAPVQAQQTPAATTGSTANQTTGGEAPARRVAPSRMQAANQRDPRNTRGPRPPSPQEAMAKATEMAAALQTGCQVTEATFRGNSARGQQIFEAACATGPGYILIAAAPAVANPPAEAIAATAADCVDLFGQADIARQRDPAVDVGLQCEIPANQDVLKVVTGYAQTAGVTCAIDQGSATGVRNGKTVYEVGCPNADGYWIEREGAGWKATPCLQIRSASDACRYTTPAEQSATVKAWLAGSDAASCDVAEVRYMGANANGAFYEAKCNGADGVIARLDAAKAVQQIYPCATAQRIGGGCTLTPAPAAPAAAPAPGSRR